MSSSTLTCGLPEEAEAATFGVPVDELAHLLGADAALSGHPVDLLFGVPEADVGVEPGPAGEQGVGSDIGGAGAIELRRSGSPLLDRRHQVRVLRPQVGRRRRERIIAVTRCRGPALEVLRHAVERLADQRGPDDLAVLFHQGTVGTSRKHDLGETGQNQGVGEPEKHGHHDDHPKSSPDLTDCGLGEGGGHEYAFQPMPGIWDTRRSMSLMPTKGAMMPPRP